MVPITLSVYHEVSVKACWSTTTTDEYDIFSVLAISKAHVPVIGAGYTWQMILTAHKQK